MDLQALNRRKNLWLRNIKMRAAAILLDKKNPHVFTVDATKTLRKILLLRNDNKLGDMIVMSAVLRELKKQLPQTEISVIAGPSSAQLLKQNPYISQIYIAKNTLWDSWRLGHKLRQAAFDLWVDFDLQNTAATILLLHLINPKYAFGFNRKELKLYNLATPLTVTNTHITNYYQKLFDVLGLTFADKKPEIFLPSAALEKANTFLKSLPAKPVAINAFAASKHRCLRWEQVQKITEHFQNIPFLLLGSAKQRKNFFPTKNLPKNIILPPNDFNLFDLLALLKQSRLLISPDTMWVHAAAALKVPQICLYKASDSHNQTVWKPLCDNAFILQAPDEFSKLDVGQINALLKTLVEIEK